MNKILKVKGFFATMIFASLIIFTGGGNGFKASRGGGVGISSEQGGSHN